MTEKKKAAPKKPVSKKAGKAAEPKRSLLREAAEQAQKELLLKTAKACDWSLKKMADALNVTTPSIVRALRELAPKEYGDAKTEGKVRVGRPPGNS